MGGSSEYGRVHGSFVEPDERAAPLLHAIGRVVWAAAALEKVLLMEIVRLRHKRDGVFPPEVELAKLELATAGQLLNQLRDLLLPDDLVKRIEAAIEGRNRLIHHPLENPEMVRAIASGEGVAAVLEKIDRLALDCGELAVELHTVAAARLEVMLGTSREELLAMLNAVDLETIEDPRLRDQLEAVRAFGDLYPPPDEDP
jgi:hypothetical protein